MLYKNRKIFDSIGSTLGSCASRISLSANQWTLLSIFTALVAGCFIATSSFLAAAFFLAITGLIDMIDGAVARFRKSSSSRGAYLDTITDRYVEFILLFSFLFANLADVLISAHAWVMLGLFGAMMTTYAKAAAKEKNIKEITGGILERSERLILLFIGLLLGLIAIEYLTYVIVIYAVLSNITALQRIAPALKTAENHDSY